MSTYRRKEILDLERLLPELPEPMPVDLDDPTLDDDARCETAAAVEAEKETLDPAELARRMAVVPEGWRVDRRTAFGATGELALTDLPSGEELRFAARRDREVFRVEGSVVVDPTAVTRVQLLWPAGEIGDAPEPRTVDLTSSVDSVDGAPLPVGAAWTERR